MHSFTIAISAAPTQSTRFLELSLRALILFTFGSTRVHRPAKKGSPAATSATTPDPMGIHGTATCLSYGSWLLAITAIRSKSRYPSWLLPHLSARETRDSFRARHTGTRSNANRSPPRKVTHQQPPRPSWSCAMEPLSTGGLSLTPCKKTPVHSTYRPQVVWRVRDRFFLGMTSVDTAMRSVTLYPAEKHVWWTKNPGVRRVGARRS